MSPEYRIFETNRFSRDPEEISPGIGEALKKKLRGFVYPQLRAEPHFGPHIKKLRAWKPDTWRYRVGSWRFFYAIAEKEKTIFMLTAEHRSSAYRKR